MFIVAGLFGLGCGKYAPPIVPELTAPSAVEELEVAPQVASVLLSWTASDSDVRGKELRMSESIIVERATVDTEQIEPDVDYEFRTLVTLKDSHVSERDQLRKDARGQGKIGRRIEAPRSSMTFSYEDSEVQRDAVYVYQVVPLNQGGVRGEVREQVKVVFQGLESSVTRLATKEQRRASGRGATDRLP
jgi:hypothetical protein